MHRRYRTPRSRQVTAAMVAVGGFALVANAGLVTGAFWAIWRMR